MDKNDIYTIGFPAKRAQISFIKLVMKYANKGDSILDIGGGEGVYSEELKIKGFKPICVDINKDYIKQSEKKGIESYVMDATSLNFSDKSFDVVLLFEVLEHIKDFKKVLKEAERVAKKYIIITVPNCSGFDELYKLHLTYDHFLATDHVNFFTKDDLEGLLSEYFNKFKVKEFEPVAIEAANLPFWLRYPILLSYKLNLIKNNVYYRLYAVVEVA